MNTEGVPSAEQRHFALALALLADRQNVNKQDLASAGDITSTYLRFLFKGKRAPSLKTGGRIAKALGTTYADMLRLGRLLHDGVSETEALSQWQQARKTLARDSVISLLRGYFESVIQWQCEETDGDATAAVNFTGEFERRFPEYREWRERRHIIKNSEAGESGLIGTAHSELCSQ